MFLYLFVSEVFYLMEFLCCVDVVDVECGLVLFGVVMMVFGVIVCLIGVVVEVDVVLLKVGVEGMFVFLDGELYCVVILKFEVGKDSVFWWEVFFDLDLLIFE